MVAPDEGREQRAMWNGFSNALGTAFEFVATTVIFTLLGLWLDSRFDTRPIFTVAFMLLAIAGLSVSAYYRYKDQIRRAEEGKPWTRNPAK